MPTFILLLHLSVAAAPVSNLVGAFPQEILRHEIVKFSPAPGHHFSQEAPQRCAGHAPLEMTPRQIKCQFSVVGTNNGTLNVCDDAKTFCRPVEVQLQVLPQESGEPQRLLTNQDLNKKTKTTLVPGFVEGTPEDIKKQAAALGKPVLVMISTDWCPPCNEAKEYLLNTDFFAQLSAGWLKVYVDGDALGAAEWEKVVPFKFYPSFVFLNSRMQEVSRFDGKMRQADFADWAHASVSQMGRPMAAVQQRIRDRREGRWKRRLIDWWKGYDEQTKREDEVRFLKWAMIQDRHEDVDWLLKNKEYEELNLEIAHYRLRKDPPANVKKDLLVYILDRSLNREDWSAVLSYLCEADRELCRQYDDKVNDRIMFLQKRTHITQAEKLSLLGEEYYYLNRAFEEVGDSKRSRTYALECVKAYKQLREFSRLELPRGAQQGLVACQELAGQWSDAEKTLRTLIAIYPLEPTFLVRMARLKAKQKNFAEALTWVEKAEQVAYGYNWFSALNIKSDILISLNRRDEAAEIIKQALSELRLERDITSRNQIWVARLRAMQNKINESK